MTVEAPILKRVRADFDTPWKHALNLYFRDFMEFCFPDIAEQIDWEKGYKSLYPSHLQILVFNGSACRKICPI